MIFYNYIKENILVPRNIEGRKEKLQQNNIKLLSQEIIEDELEDRQYVIGTKSTDNIVTSIASTMNDLNNLGGI